MQSPFFRSVLGPGVLLLQYVGAPVAISQQPAGAPVPAPSAPVQLPAFQPGLWEYQRTVLSAANPRPQKSSVRKCTDPSSEIRRRMTELMQKGCQFSPIQPRGNQYLSSWRCPVTSGLLVDRNVVTVQDKTRYQDDNEVHSGEHVTRSTVVAKRVGECPVPLTNSDTSRAR